MLSSWPAERLPAMCGSATLAMEVSSTSMNVASVTAMAMIHGLTAGRHASALSSGPRSRAHCRIQTLGIDRHARAQLMVLVFAGIEHDLDRNALHHFHIVAGGIFRRQAG